VGTVFISGILEEACLLICPIERALNFPGLHANLIELSFDGVCGINGAHTRKVSDPNPAALTTDPPTTANL
jgi:hypothetical protein